jgi:hypothetical protein
MKNTITLTYGAILASERLQYREVTISEVFPMTAKDLMI